LLLQLVLLSQLLSVLEEQEERQGGQILAQMVLILCFLLSPQLVVVLEQAQAEALVVEVTIAV